jgi:hypothetical protein
MNLKDGIDGNGLSEYCNEIAKELKNTDLSSEYIFFDITSQAIKSAVRSYQDIFIEIGNRVFAYRQINPAYFNSRFSNEIAKSLETAAVHYAEKVTK